jgi:DNA-binding transcriptional ArsR family regulator
MTDAPHATAAVDADAALDALGSGVPRAILTAASRQPTTVEELADSCDVSESTIYRHLGRLVDAGLVRKEGRTDSETAPTYRTTAESLVVDVGADGISIDRDRPDEFTEALRTVVSHLDVRRVDYDADADPDVVDVTLGVVGRDAGELVDLCHRLLDGRCSDVLASEEPSTDAVPREN